MWKALGELEEAISSFAAAFDVGALAPGDLAGAL